MPNHPKKIRTTVLPTLATIVAMAIATTALLHSTVASAAPPAWPVKPITIIVPFPAGGGTDVVMRAIQPQLSKALGQPVVIDNRSGAGGTVGSALVARAQPDGYTAGIVTTSTHAVSPSVYKSLPYDPVTDFSYVGFIGTSPYVLVTNVDLHATDVKSLLAILKTGKTNNFASVGVGTVSHLMGAKFQQLTDSALIHVPYRGAAPAYTDLIGGQVQMMFDNPIALSAYVSAKKLSAIATTAATPLLPDVPTFAQQGIEGFTQELWYGIALPKNTPPEIVARFNDVLNGVLTDPAVVADLTSKGVTPKPATPQALQDAVAHDVPFWRDIAQSVGANIE